MIIEATPNGFTNEIPGPDGDYALGVRVTGTEITYGPDGAPISGTVTSMTLFDTRTLDTARPAGQVHDFRQYTGLSLEVENSNAFDSDWYGPDAFESLQTFDPEIQLVLLNNDPVSDTGLIAQGDFDYNVLASSKISSVITGDGNDTIQLGLGQNTVVRAGGGDDAIIGGIGKNDNDFVDFPGADEIYGGAGDDTIYGNKGSDLIFGGVGDDIVFGGWGADTIRGGSGNDDLRGGQVFDEIYGGSGDDFVGGGEGSDKLWGDDGDDILMGNKDDDKIWGGTGNDLLYGEDGDDELTAGSGNNKLFGGAGDDELSVHAYTDAGEHGNNLLHGGAGQDLIKSGLGSDILFGGAGQDRIQSNGGTDILDGGGGDDVLFARNIDENEGEADTLTGGAGADTFVFSDFVYDGSVTVTDFDSEEDLLRVLTRDDTSAQEQYDLFLTGASQNGDDIFWVDADGKYTARIENLSMTDLSLDNFADTPYSGYNPLSM